MNMLPLSSQIFPCLSLYLLGLNEIYIQRYELNSDYATTESKLAYY